MHDSWDLYLASAFIIFFHQNNSYVGNTTVWEHAWDITCDFRMDAALPKRCHNKWGLQAFLRLKLRVTARWCYFGKAHPKELLAGDFWLLLISCKLIEILVEHTDSHTLWKRCEPGVLHAAPTDFFPSALRRDGWINLIHHCQELTDILLSLPLQNQMKSFRDALETRIEKLQELRNSDAI